jgi:hypothetical protein
MTDRNIFSGTIIQLEPGNRVLIKLDVNSIPPIDSRISIKDGENLYEAIIRDSDIEEKENFPDIRYIGVETDLPVDFIPESRVEMQYIIPHFKHKRSTQKSKKRGNPKRSTQKSKKRGNPKRSAPKRRKTKHSKLKSKKH